MKSFVKKSFASLLLLGASAGLFACGNGETETSSSDTGVEVEQSFVAVTASEWDAEVTVGSHIYTFDLTLATDKTLSFEATCVRETSSGGGGFPGFGSVVDSTSESVDYSSYDFSFSGSWELETGYGYILSFSDEAKSTIHVDYNKTQGRHEFYYAVTTSEGSVTTLFQARDSSFRSTLADDYASWDERDSTYIFTGEVEGNNNSVANGYIYCHKDGSAVFNTANGSDREVTLGLSWTLTDGTFTLIDGETSYVASNSINSEHPGYRIAYDGYSFYCSTSDSVSWNQMSNEDFDGATLYQFTGSFEAGSPQATTYEVELNLTVLNTAYLYTNGNLSSSGTYTFENEVFTITLSGDYGTKEVSKNEDGSYTYTYDFVVSSFFGSSTTVVSITYTPTEA